jgi:nucleotide-binding universal stress UspA family protein
MVKSLFSNILVAISGSGASVSAAKYAIIMAKQYRCRLTAVYVVDTATLKQLTFNKIFIAEESAEYEQSLRVNGERYLSYIKDLAEAKGVRMETELREGAIPTQIAHAAEEINADLIILGGYEKGRASKDVISRAHMDILHVAKSTVLTVKDPNVDILYKMA